MPDDAADVVRRALRLSPRARELRHLAAIAAYRRNDLASASESLDALLRSSPRDDLAALNRALIEVEAGERDGGCGVLNELAAAAADPMVRQRARELVTQFACP